jgi:hypothetical protein
MEEEKAELAGILEEMDIPEFRKHLHRFRNTRWLHRTLSIRNRNHPKCSQVLEMIQRINNANRLNESLQFQGVTNDRTL